MNCPQVQSNLSLYLYGELDFASEEQVEEHLKGCAFCQLALTREKEWHASLNGSQPGVPLELLQACRAQLSTALPQCARGETSVADRWRAWRHFSVPQFALWPARAAAAVLLLIAGFGAGRLADRRGLMLGAEAAHFAQPMQAGMLNPYTRVRDIQSNRDGGVRLLIEEVQQNEIDGTLTQAPVRRLVLAATKDSSDPGIRVDSVEVLVGQNGEDVRDALLESVRQDPNAAVRLKALEALRGFASDPITRKALIGVLQNDENPGVRSQAIDILLPGQNTQLTPELVNAMQRLMAAPGDDYVRARCAMALHEASVPVY